MKSLRFFGTLVLSSLLGFSTLVLSPSAQGITLADIQSQVSAACTVDQLACQGAIQQSMALLPGLPAADQASYGTFLAQLAIANPLLAAFIMAALTTSGNVLVVAGFNASSDGAFPTVVAVASPA